MSGRGGEEPPSSPGGEWQSAASRRTRNSNRTGAGSSKGSERSRAGRGSGRGGGARGGQRGGRGADSEGRSSNRAKQAGAAPEAAAKPAASPAAAATKPAGADGVAEQLFSARVVSPVTASGFDSTTAVQMLTSRMCARWPKRLLRCDSDARVHTLHCVLPFIVLPGMVQVQRAAKTGASIDQCKVVAYQQRALPAKTAWGK